MILAFRFGLAVTLTTLLGAATCLADTWTDATGKFSVEAEYVGVEGQAVVLRKADGATINVPISKLSAESRAKAKALYEAARAGTPPTNTTPPTGTTPAASGSASGNLSAANLDVGVAMPHPPTIKPMDPFPADASLQQTITHLRDQIMAGHPEVIWHALPTSMRAKLDSDEVRDAMQPMIEQQSQVTKPVEELVKKVVQVLVKQKQFILNSNMVTSQVPPPMMPMIQQAYDPAVGILYELINMQFAFQGSDNRTFTQVLDYHGPRIGGHMQALMPMLPPGAVDQVFSQIQVAQTGPTSGTVTTPDGEGGQQVTEMVKYEDRWIPKDLADEWDVMKDSLAENMANAWAQANADNPQAMQQANMMVGMVAATAGGMIDPLLNAGNQQEFDQAMMQLMGLATMFGGGGPGGPGGPGGFPGGPPGGFPPGEIAPGDGF